MELVNKYNYKSGDKYKTKSFIGDIIILKVFESYLEIKMEHVSGNNYYSNISHNEFNNNFITGEITTFIKS